jgi:hypothetical protein
MVILVADLIASYNRTIEQDKAQTRQRGTSTLTGSSKNRVFLGEVFMISREIRPRIKILLKKSASPHE